MNDDKNEIPKLPTMDDDLGIPSPSFEAKSLESSKDLEGTTIDHSIPQPPSIKVLDMSSGDQPRHIEISKEIIPDRQVEIHDEVNPITSDLNKVSDQVIKGMSISKVKKHGSEGPKKSPFDREPSNMEMLKNYIGQNSNKIIDRLFNFSAIIFGTLYYAYRKMYLLGILFFIGFLGEYIMAMNNRIMNRPLVIEEERINFEEKDVH